jgi:hypothetical protein
LSLPHPLGNPLLGRAARFLQECPRVCPGLRPPRPERLRRPDGLLLSGALSRGLGPLVQCC